MSNVNDLLEFIKWNKLRGNNTSLSIDESYLIVNEIERLRAALTDISDNGPLDYTDNQYDGCAIKDALSDQGDIARNALGNRYGS